MKKLSISLFAVAVVILTATSAFTKKITVKKSLGITNRYGIICLFPCAQSSAIYTATSIISKKMISASPFEGIRYDSDTDLGFTTVNQLEAWIAANPTTVENDVYDLVCNTSNNCICMAYLDTGRIPESLQVRVVILGEFAFVLRA